MPAIEKLIIKGFKAFPGDFELNFDGKHLLMYGENGSGKSSIYYALHCLYQSPLKSDAGKKYFNVKLNGNPNNEHLLNLSTMRDDAMISLQFDSNHQFRYDINKDGYKTKYQGGLMPLPGDVEGVFVNHNFISNFFDFRNSEYINLFPVFRKDILPYCYMPQGYCLGEKYETIIHHVPKNGKRVQKLHYDNINSFNTELSTLIGDMNLKIMDLYNQHFKAPDDQELRVKLYYGDPDSIVINGYQLKYDYQRIIKYDNGMPAEYQNSYRSHNEPFIRLDIDELQDDGTYKQIPKPQTYFNEAKLTAIALSIRFSLLDLVSAPNGRFMALDDMLISLDMSNRTKVVDFLLSISDKYKIYLLTHNLDFYEMVRKKIEKEHKQKDEWVMGRLYMNDHKTLHEPEFINERDKIKHAEQYLISHDYPACGIYLRRECEEILDKLLPMSLKTKIVRDEVGNDTTVSLNLNDKILNLELFCNNEGLNYSKFKTLKVYKDVLLNSLAHNDSSSPIYKAELKSLIAVIKELKLIIRNRTMVKNSKDCRLKLPLTDRDVYVCFRTREALLAVECNSGYCNISYYSKCELIKIIDAGTETIISKGYESVHDLYKEYCDNYGVEPAGNLLDITDYRGELLRTKIGNV